MSGVTIAGPDVDVLVAGPDVDVLVAGGVGDVLVVGGVGDSVFGTAAAQAAGMRCVAVPVTTDGISAAGGSADVVVVEILHPGLLAETP